MTERDVNNELMAELLKLRDILDWESQWARIGYLALALELVTIAVFFGLLIITSSGHG